MAFIGIGIGIGILLATSAVADQFEYRSGSKYLQCNTGDAVCCNTVGKASEASISKVLGLLDVVVGDVNEVVGVKCSPIIGSNKCEQKPVCCDDNKYNGVVAIGCSPIEAL